VLDGCRCAKGDEWERVGVRIMNQIRKSPHAVNIQSSSDVFLVGMFKIQKEDHQTLKAKLAPLNVEVKDFRGVGGHPPATVDLLGLGQLPVKIRLGADLKTAHAIYNVQSGHNSPFQNLFDPFHFKCRNPLSQNPKYPYTPAPGICREPAFWEEAALCIPPKDFIPCGLHILLRLVDHMLNKHVEAGWDAIAAPGEDSAALQKMKDVLTLHLDEDGFYMEGSVPSPPIDLTADSDDSDDESIEEIDLAADDW
jgi:hypothetical protein